MTGVLAWSCCLVVLLWNTQAAAHTRSQSFSSWHIQDGQVRGTFSVRALEATRLGALEDAVFDLNTLLVRHLDSRLVLTAGDEPCRTAGPRARAAQAGYVRVEWRFACPAHTRLSLTSTAFFEVAPSHLHYARVRVGGGPPVEYLFTDSARRQVIVPDGPEQAARPGPSFGAYVLLGLEHIMSGVDHLAFVLALLLLCRHVREVVFMVSGFTLGHSLTLSLAVLGVLEPNVPVIEALIGFTLALVAAENIGITSGTGRRLGLVAGLGLVGCGLLRGLTGLGLPVLSSLGLGLFAVCYFALATSRERAARLRPVLTLVFGLIHGFGFASVLLDLGLPTERLVVALFGFNLGVELGQLGVVALVWAGGQLLVRGVGATDYRLATDAASAGLCGLGLFWFVERAFG
ncbi:MAG: HupE/UreJ family protein [Desulfurellaceae bacterium]|nr:HupE/UreJ family protein [Desulfurellaceae bacterium]